MAKVDDDACQMGLWCGRIEHDNVKVVEGKKAPQLMIPFSMTHRKESGSWVKVDPFIRSVYLSLSEQAIMYTAKKLASLGYAGSITKPVFPERPVEITHYKDKEGKHRWEPSSFLIGGEQKTFDNAEQLNRINALLNSQFTNSGYIPNAPAQPKPAAQPTGVSHATTADPFAPNAGVPADTGGDDGDDLPF